MNRLEPGPCALGLHCQRQLWGGGAPTGQALSLSGGVWNKYSEFCKPFKCCSAGSVGLVMVQIL